MQQGKRKMTVNHTAVFLLTGILIAVMVIGGSVVMARQP